MGRVCREDGPPSAHGLRAAPRPPSVPHKARRTGAAPPRGPRRPRQRARGQAGRPRVPPGPPRPYIEVGREKWGPFLGSAILFLDLRSKVARRF